MEKDWTVYCLMSGIAIIEEFSKPKRHKQIKNNKTYFCYQAIRLKMKNKDIVDKWIKITRIWEKKLKQKFITDYFKEAHKEKDQFLVYFLPNWAYHILREIKHFPSKHTNSLYHDRIKNWKKSKDIFCINSKEIKKIQDSKSGYDILFKNKLLAAGAFIISFDLECRGAQCGRLDLTMSEKYKDFLEFMLRVANKHDWATKSYLSDVKVDYSIKRGIKATPQHCFRIKSSKLKEIYSLAGPLLDEHKDKCINFNIKRSKNYVNKGGSRIGIMRNKIYLLIKKLGPTNTTELQFYVNIGVDVILGHLNRLHKEGLINKERQGKRYMWSIKNAS